MIREHQVLRFISCNHMKGKWKRGQTLKGRYRRRLESIGFLFKELNILHKYFHSYHSIPWSNVWIAISLNSAFPGLILKTSIVLLLLRGECCQELISYHIIRKSLMILKLSWLPYEQYVYVTLMQDCHILSQVKNMSIKVAADTSKSPSWHLMEEYWKQMEKRAHSNCQTIETCVTHTNVQNNRRGKALTLSEDPT